ncbi:MAG: hypothetical protein Q8K00_05410 [Syntrophales bacterium]|nr:hypothetical protein [Syntrophales bacterium]
MFMILREMAIFFSVTFLSGKSSLFSATRAITAFPSVNRDLGKREEQCAHGKIVPGHRGETEDRQLEADMDSSILL